MHIRRASNQIQNKTKTGAKAKNRHEATWNLYQIFGLTNIQCIEYAKISPTEWQVGLGLSEIQ